MLHPVSGIAMYVISVMPIMFNVGNLIQKNIEVPTKVQENVKIIV